MDSGVAGARATRETHLLGRRLQRKRHVAVRVAAVAVVVVVVVIVRYFVTCYLFVGGHLSNSGRQLTACGPMRREAVGPNRGSGFCRCRRRRAGVVAHAVIAISSSSPIGLIHDPLSV